MAGVRFERVAAAFHDMSRVWLCESSGSEYSPDSLANLSDLVNSFIERDGGGVGAYKKVELETDQNHSDSSEYWSGSDAKEMLQNLFGCDGDGDQHDAKHKICAETESASFGLIGDGSSPGYKRQLMARLRDRGFDAG